MTITGEWWNQASRPLMRSQGAVSQDVASCDLADGIVSSEKATATLRSHSILLPFDGTTSTEAAGVAVVESTARVAWRPRTNVNVLGVKLITLGLYGNATCDNFTLYGNAGTCITDIALKAVSTALVRGTLTTGGVFTQVALAACTDVLLKLFTSTCSQPGKAAIQVDYETSDG